MWNRCIVMYACSKGNMCEKYGGMMYVCKLGDTITIFDKPGSAMYLCSSMRKVGIV
jgi:hypothetical protein